MSWLVWLAVGAGAMLAVYTLACLVLAHLFTSGAKAWTWPLRATPADLGLAYEDMTFPASDGLHISAWWLPSQGTTAVVMIPGGGTNRLLDNTQYEQPQIAALEIAAALVAAGRNVLMYDPRACGGSEGSRIGYGSTEARDLVGALDWLGARGTTPEEVAVLAWSMGCATAMFALDERRYAGLIADSALAGFSRDDVVRYASIALSLPQLVVRPLAVVLVPGVFLACRALWGMRLRDQPLASLRRHPVPTVVIHGRGDRVVPVATGEALAAAAGAQLVAAHYLDGVDHMGAYRSDKAWYIATIVAALDTMLVGTPIPQSAGE